MCIRDRIATAADSRNDVISTAAVLAAAVLSLATGLPLDGWMGLAVAVFLFVSGIGLVRDTVNPLLGEAPSEELTQYIARKVLSLSLIHIWRASACRPTAG